MLSEIDYGNIMHSEDEIMAFNEDAEEPNEQDHRLRYGNVFSGFDSSLHVFNRLFLEDEKWRVYNIRNFSSVSVHPLVFEYYSNFCDNALLPSK